MDILTYMDLLGLQLGHVEQSLQNAPSLSPRRSPPGSSFQGKVTASHGMHKDVLKGLFVVAKKGRKIQLSSGTDWNKNYTVSTECRTLQSHQKCSEFVVGLIGVSKALMKVLDPLPPKSMYQC